MEKINTDYKQRIWKIEAKLFNMRKPWRSSFNEVIQTRAGLFESQLALTQD